MDIEAIKDGQGDLPAWAWPGGYPLYYLSGEGNEILCPYCANSEADCITAYGVNWEDPMLICEECNERIESAYAEDEVNGDQAARDLDQQ